MICNAHNSNKLQDKLLGNQREIPAPSYSQECHLGINTQAQQSDTRMSRLLVCSINSVSILWICQAKSTLGKGNIKTKERESRARGIHILAGVSDRQCNDVILTKNLNKIKCNNTSP